MRQRAFVCAIFCGIGLCLAGLCLSPILAQADETIAGPGQEGGQIQGASGLATDEADGTLFVADRGNRRVDVFDADGNFIRAFGWGVVASGPGNDPRNELEKIEVAATGGTFSLLFVQNNANPIGTIKQETASVAFDASAAAVQAALEGLAAINPGDIAVSGSAGGPYTIEFRGSYADTDVHQLEEGEASGLTGGASEMKIGTTQIGANYEICEEADGDVCRAGQRGSYLAGQLNPTSVAVDPATGDVYVFDSVATASTNEEESLRVQKFSAEGEFLYMLGGGVNLTTGADLCTAASGDECGPGVSGTGAGEFGSFASSLDVGPGGVLYVNVGGRVQKFTSAGAPAGQVSLPGVEPQQVAIDSVGNIYAIASQSEVRKYDSTGTLLNTISATFTRAIGLDSGNNLYVSDQESGSSGISRYDSAGNLELVFYSMGSAIISAPSPAIAPGLGGVDVVDQDEINRVSIPSLGPVVYPVEGAAFADPIGNLRATLNGQVNPEGKATTYHFEYVEQAAFEAEGWAASSVKETAESAPIGSDFLLHEAQAQIGCVSPGTEAAKCLTPSTEYRFRLVATNADATEEGPDVIFKTKPPVEFGPLWTTEVDSGAAILHAEVNPVGFATTGYFELVTEGQFEATGFAGATKLPAGTPLDFGLGETFVERNAEATGLEPGTAYRYRLVVENNCKPLEPTFVCVSASDFEDPAPRFSTFVPSKEITGCPNDATRPDRAAFLPDCRGYEMVSPVDKDGVNIEVGYNFTNFLANFDQSALDGEAITYGAYKAFAEPEGSPFSSQYLAKRSSVGWTSKSISPPREGPMINIGDALDFQFKGFTDDLCLGWVRQDTAKPILAEGAVEGYENLYRRDNCNPGEGSYETVSRTEVPVDADPLDYRPQLEGFSKDGSKTVFSVAEKLTSNARNNKVQAYESIGGTVKLVCVLPGAEAKAATNGCTLGSGPDRLERGRSVFNAVSDDGSHVFWSSDEKLYVRIDGTETVAISEAISAAPAFFWGASADGSRVIFTIGDNLYEVAVASKTPTLLAEGVMGVAGMSDDAERIYFASTKDLASGAEAGKANLYYRDEDGGTKFIAVLPNAAQLLTPISREPHRRTSQVTSDGEQIVFMTNGSPTGYDNRDAKSGEADQEVFVYDTTANAGAGDLLCASCNPSGARPEGRQIRLNGFSFPVAAIIPVATSQNHTPRAISATGSRVFFTSYDPLVDGDLNGKADVYQWERLGAGDCTESTLTYSASASGCISLISSGQSNEDSTFVDSSLTGDDIFFKTYSSFVPQDPGLLDIYDARTGGGFPVSAPESPECEEEDCPGFPTPPPVAISPSSSAPTSGNPPQGKKPRRCPKGKHRVKRKGKVVCVNNKKKRSAHRSRGAGK